MQIDKKMHCFLVIVACTASWGQFLDRSVEQLTVPAYPEVARLGRLQMDLVGVLEYSSNGISSAPIFKLTSASPAGLAVQKLFEASISRAVAFWRMKPGIAKRSHNITFRFKLVTDGELLKYCGSLNCPTSIISDDGVIQIYSRPDKIQPADVK